MQDEQLTKSGCTSDIRLHPWCRRNVLLFQQQ